MDRILVCITPQSNSKRLIDKAAEEAGSAKDELYILNIQKGDNIFLNEDSGEILDQLFAYGSKKGGSVHALAGDDVPTLITNFSIKEKVTKIILGETPKDIQQKSGGIIDELKKRLKNVKFIELQRE